MDFTNKIDCFGCGKTLKQGNTCTSPSKGTSQFRYCKTCNFGAVLFTTNDQHDYSLVIEKKCKACKGEVYGPHTCKG